MPDLSKYKIFKQWLAITVGCILSALGYVVFIIPLNFFEGGVIGLGFLAKHITGLPIIGIVSLSITMVIFAFAAKKMGKSFGARSLYAIILSNVLLDVFTLWKKSIYPGTISDDMLLNGFYGGIIIGFGMGLVFYNGASTGGADALAQIMKRFRQVPIGRTLISIDIFVLSLATYFAVMEFGFPEGLVKIMYSFIFIFIQIKVADTVLNGLNASQQILIISDKPEEIKQAIFERLGRGITFYKGIGAYTGEERITLSTVIPTKETPIVRRIVEQIDPASFVIIQDVHQVFGEGFEKLYHKSAKK